MPSHRTVSYDAIGASKLFTDYLAGELADRFPGDPFDLENHVALARKLGKRDYPRAELLERLAEYNQELGAGEATLLNIDLIKKPHTFVVCTGQQPAIATGPLYTIYKAMTCTILARQLTALAGDLTFVPVFWCASEDHDLEEMNHAWVPSDGEPRRVRAKLTNTGQPAEAVRVDKRVRAAFDELVGAIPDTEFKRDVVALFEPAQRDTLGTWFNRILLRLFTDQGLIALEPRLIRELGVPVLQRELETWNESSETLAAGAEALEALGYDAAFDGDPKVHCFFIEDGKRGRIKTYADCCILGDAMVERRELPVHLQDHIDRFSPDASLRPIVQSSILPVTTYVAGPGEIAYYAQLAEMHAHFDVPMPLIYPRASVTLLEGSVIRGMEKYGIALEALFDDPKKHLDAIERPSKDDGLPNAIDALRDDFRTRVDAMRPDVEALGDGTAKVFGKVTARIAKDLDYVHKRVTGAIDEAAGVGERQLERLFQNAFPRGTPQERVHNVLYYLAKYGLEVTRSLALVVQDPPREHVVYSVNPRHQLPDADA